MAEEADPDDQWLYGDAPDLAPTDQHLDENAEEKLLEDSDSEQQSVDNGNNTQSEHIETEPTQTNGTDEPAPPGADEENAQPPEDNDEATQHNGENSEKEESAPEDDDDDDSDDDINVVIGDIKTTPAYTPLNIKRGGLISTVGDKSKLQQPQTGKFTVDEFEQMGMINGVQAGEFSLDTIEDKPWRKPGADITDYFNYGFNEDTWRAYCERQKRIRVNESGVGLIPLNAIGLPRGPAPIMNDNSKYSNNFTGIRKAGPPPGRRMTGAIDVIGGSSSQGQGSIGGGGNKMDAPKENVIQVMTADRREYSRKPPGFPDLSMPPPHAFEEFQPEFGFNPEPEPFYGGYEPTQDLQWSNNTNWVPNDIKSLTPGPSPVPHQVPPPQMTTLPPVNQPPPSMVLPPVGMAPQHELSPQPMHQAMRHGDSDSRERDHESRARSEKPPREHRTERADRERSHRRERSRSRSRRHKSRSRSPSHRSHKKKKSRRHEESD